jgi:hypothetical protein
MIDPQEQGASGKPDRAGGPTDLSRSASQPEALIPSVAVLNRMVDALMFYAMPENWHGVYMMGHGPMTDDWTDDYNDFQYPNGKPGHQAREIMRELADNGLLAQLDDTQGIEAGTATTGTGVVHESPVGNADAP